MIFLPLKIIFSAPQNELSDVNKTRIQGQKFSYIQNTWAPMIFFLIYYYFSFIVYCGEFAWNVQIERA